MQTAITVLGLLTSVGTLITAMIAIKRVQEVHLSINSRFTEFLALAKNPVSQKA